MCGVEFCAACFPNSPLCLDCTSQMELDDDEFMSPEEKEISRLVGFEEDELEREELGEEPFWGIALKPSAEPAKPAPEKKSPPATVRPKVVKKTVKATPSKKKAPVTAAKVKAAKPQTKDRQPKVKAAQPNPTTPKRSAAAAKGKAKPAAKAPPRRKK